MQSERKGSFRGQDLCRHFEWFCPAPPRTSASSWSSFPPFPAGFDLRFVSGSPARTRPAQFSRTSPSPPSSRSGSRRHQPPPPGAAGGRGLRGDARWSSRCSGGRRTRLRRVSLPPLLVSARGRLCPGELGAAVRLRRPRCCLPPHLPFGEGYCWPEPCRSQGGPVSAGGSRAQVKSDAL